MTNNPEKKMKSKKRLHYNSEPSQERLINREISRLARQEERIKKQEAIEKSWTEEIKSKHFGLIEKKELAQKYAEMKVKALEEKGAEIQEKLLKAMEANPKKNPLEKYATLIEKYREIEAEHAELMKIIGITKNKISYFGELLIRISKINPHIIRYYPAEVFTAPAGKSPLSLRFLSLEELETIQKTLEASPEVFYNSTFKNEYLKFFPAYIGRLTKFNDVVYALKLKPSAWLNVPASFLTNLDQSPSLFKIIASEAPSALKYMGKDMLYKFGKDYYKSIGSAILRDPEILDHMDDKFFVMNNPKFVFDKSKATVAAKIGDRVKKFPTLASYLNYHENVLRSMRSEENIVD